MNKVLILALVLCGGVPASALASPLLQPTSTPVVQTTAGGVLGRVEDGIAVFRGVPYAAAPVGVLRWAPPQPPPAWTGVRTAAAFGPVCPQPIEPWANGETGDQSEDCLSLNIWTPAKTAPNARLPVMLWIHGGGYTAGAGSQSTYDGRALAARGAVIVTINYRLGVLGFLAHPALTAESPLKTSGDYGLLDQIAALRWVKDNIAAFGGDPDNVTIFGESAGGGSVLLLTISPLARGLFSKAIVESGAALDLPDGDGARPSAAVAQAAGAAFAARLGAATLADLRALPAARLIGADAPAVSTHPIVDGAIVPTDLTLAYRAGRDAGAPLLLGWNSAEGVMFAHPKSRADYEAGVREAAGRSAPAVLALYPADSRAPLSDTAAAEIGDTTFGWRGWSVAQAQAQARTGRAPVFVYQFDNAPPRPADSPYHTPGTVHSEELGFVWGSPAQARWPAQDRALSDTVQRYWINFARTGDPNGPHTPPWPRFTPSREQVMWFKDGKARPGPVPRLEALRALDAAIAGASTP